MAWIFIFLAALSSCAGNLCLKYSRMQAVIDSLWWQKLISPWFIAGMFFYLVNVMLFAKALDRLAVSLAYPVLAAIGFALLVMASAFLFGEVLAPRQYFGIAFILGGIVLIALPN